ncbi:hypothetical protein CK203_078185 [Vitis vinifera]|uniref:Uncharacterized protein n=1 Tax=Vitis vinifera TaxID=29760 RepID=A0A438DUW0_VITVI|nr:hypothetical protein CK203_078185 [Vitis vinifera]
MEERNEVGEPCWQSSCLAKFSRCLGMPTEGFEGEILFLLKRMKEMKIQKGKLDGRKKRILESSRFEKELRKLEWTVKYLGGGEGVYSPTMRRDRECFWDELGPLKAFGIDRFLVNEKWDCRFSGSRQCVLPRPVSDHFPILLEGGGALRREWNRDVFSRVEYRKNLALDQMEFWDAKEKTNKLSLEEMEAKREAREEYKKWCEMLQNMDVGALEVSFTKEEVYGTLLGCSKDKAPGPNGF